MAVASTTAPRLTATDLTVLTQRVKRLVARGLAGTLVPVTTAEGELVVTVLDTDEEKVLFGIGKEQGWYYLFCADGVPVAQGRTIDEVLKAMPQELS